MIVPWISHPNQLHIQAESKLSVRPEDSLHVGEHNLKKNIQNCWLQKDVELGLINIYSRFMISNLVDNQDKFGLWICLFVYAKYIELVFMWIINKRNSGGHFIGLSNNIN